jgi:hypothetical protein
VDLGCVVGVVQANHARQGLGRLTAVRLWKAADLSKARTELRALVARSQEPGPALPAARTDVDHATRPA